MTNPPTPTMDLAEQVARLIEPKAFEEPTLNDNRVYQNDSYADAKAKALTKAATILDLITSARSGGEIERLEAELVEARTLDKGFYEWLIERDLIARGEEVEWADIVTALTEHEIELEAYDKARSGGGDVVELREALAELHALVRGECPRLLDEDSGGNWKLDLAITAALSRLEAGGGALPAQGPSVPTEQAGRAVVGWSEAEQLAYWRRGHAIIEGRLAKAVEAKHEDAPFPMNAEQAAAWHNAQMEAYRDALEMMGVPECVSALPVVQGGAK